jgi:hypothetical protein
MKKLIAILTLTSAAAFAQLTTTSTTLSAAISANTTTQWCVASATGISTPSLPGNNTGTYLMADSEVVQVLTSGSSSTCFQVRRGVLGTSANYSHANGVTVWVGNVASGTGDNSPPFSNGVFTPNVPFGSCTASAQYSLPVILTPGGNNNYYAGRTANCIGGFWIVGDPQLQVTPIFSSFTTLSPPNPIATSSVTDVAGKIWYSQLVIPYESLLTGACVLNGATVGTDKWMFILYDGAGAVVANTATAGVTTATASKYQCINFTATVRVKGPASYFIAVQGNGTTDNFQAYATAGAPTNYATGSQAGTFGTAAKITGLATTFTAANGPLMMVY